MMGTRLAIGTLLMGATVAYQMRRSTQEIYPTENFVFWLVGAMYFFTLLYSFILPRLRSFALLERFATWQISGDLLLVTLLVLATGCQESLFLFAYLLVIIEASVLLSRKTTFLFAAVSQVMLLILLTASLLGWVKLLVFVRQPSPLEIYDFLYVLLVYGSAFFLVALLSSHLAEQLRSSGELIQEKQSHLEALLTQHDDLRTLHRDIVMSLSSGLITMDVQGRVQFLNPVAWEILGVLPEWTGPVQILELVPSFPWQAIQARESLGSRLEVPYLRSDGQNRILGVSCSPLRDREERGVGWLILFQDLTPIKEMEESARRNERLAAIGELAAGLAHEIRNPLASLSGAIQMLQEDMDTPPEHQLLMDIAVRETERLNNLLSDFLLFARPKEAQLSPYSVAGLLREVLVLFKQDERFSSVGVELDCPEDCWVDLDPQLFEQVIWNLLINAAQATLPKKDPVQVRVRPVDSGTWIDVIDRGSGIPPEIHDRLFDPFFSTKAGGTGLGLAVVQRILSAHFGKIELHAPAEGGTCFRLCFPKSSRLQETHIEKAEKSAPSSTIEVPLDVAMLAEGGEG
ncbi:MAG: PAS domain S-box protein [Myxococcales bacterium]|nr:PAS domain S-box protein [Myxococcales bacterium]